MAKGLLAVLLLIGLSACSAGAGSSQGTVRGSVYGWPAAPLGGAEVPARGAVVMFLDASDKQVAAATADDQGRFERSLAAGRYRVLVHAFGRDPIVDAVNGKDSKGSQVYVDVKAGQTSALDILVDTGIR
jgi:hypothetical protein